MVSRVLFEILIEAVTAFAKCHVNVLPVHRDSFPEPSEQVEAIGDIW